MAERRSWAFMRWKDYVVAELLTEECIKNPGEIKSREVEVGSLKPVLNWANVSSRT